MPLDSRASRHSQIKIIITIADAMPTDESTSQVRRAADYIGSGVLLKIEVVIRPSFHKIKGEHTPLLPLSGGGYTPL
jgi:hypothetical protein